MTTDMVKQGRKNRARGATFEKRVRADLEKDGWIIFKNTNNVEFDNTGKGKLVPCKPKFNPFTKSLMMNSGGFPDYIAYKHGKCIHYEFCSRCNIIGIEAKSTGYLDKVEKDKVQWLLSNHIFAYILVASKSKKKKGEIIYNTIKRRAQKQ